LPPEPRPEAVRLAHLLDVNVRLAIGDDNEMSLLEAITERCNQLC
jgi:hypothetical protein